MGRTSNIVVESFSKSRLGKVREAKHLTRLSSDRVLLVEHPGTLGSFTAALHTATQSKTEPNAGRS